MLATHWQLLHGSSFMGSFMGKFSARPRGYRRTVLKLEFLVEKCKGGLSTYHLD